MLLQDEIILRLRLLLIYETCISIKHPTFPLVVILFAFLIRVETIIQLISKAKPSLMQTMQRNGWKLLNFLFKI